MRIYGGPVLVLDFGTATTYDLVDATGAFVSGVTAPGIRISAKALWEDAAKLRRLRSRNRTASLQKKPSRVCRLGWCMDRSDRQNTLSAI